MGTPVTPDPADDFDNILERLGGGGGNAGAADPMMTMMMMQMQNDRADRAAQRQTMLQLATAVLPAVLPLLFKKDADPLVMTLLQGTLAKNNDGEQLKQMLQMMAAANQMTMEQLKSSLLSIMDMKDQQTKRMLEDARGGEDDEPKSGPAAIMQEVRLGLTALAGLAGAAPAAPATSAALPAPQAAAANPGQPQRPRQAPVVVLLHQMRGIQSGEITGNLGAAWAAMATIALQDPDLMAALDSDDIQQVVAYCQPHIVADPKLLEWVSKEGVAAWVDQMVQRKLIPLIDVARDDGNDDAGAGDAAGDEPEELTAEGT
jgi:hypothetical protein